jgi:hypothetical protein
MAKPNLVISRIEFDSAVIAQALKITEEEATTALRDGRGAWPFSEIWGGRLYEFIKHSNTNVPLSDGAVALGQLRDATVSVKALTRGGLKFQQSKFVGYGRGTDRDGLVSSIEASDRVVVVDITEFPIVRFLPLDSTRLVSAAHTGRLTVNGWSKQKLYAWVSEVYDVSEVPLSL